MRLLFKKLLFKVHRFGWRLRGVYRFVRWDGQTVAHVDDWRQTGIVRSVNRYGVITVGWWVSVPGAGEGADSEVEVTVRPRTLRRFTNESYPADVVSYPYPAEWELL